MEIAQGIASKMVEYLVEPTIKHGRYLFCFKNIVEDLGEEEANLKSAQERMEQRVETAKRNTEIIEKDVEKWQTDTSNILADVQKLKEEIEVKQSCLNGWCPNRGCRYSLSRKAAKKMSIMIKLRDSGNNFDSVGHPAPLPGLEFSATKYFDFFKSSKDAFDQIIEALRKDETGLVGLYGMGGAGKTTLAIKLGIKVKEDEIFDEVVMVSVSQTPNFKDIQSKLARLLDIELKEEDEEERAKRLYLRFSGTKKILVILDDVWEKFDLKSKIGFPFGEDNNYCKLLLTTRKKDLCTAIGCQPRISLNLLNEDEGLTLLKRHADLNDDSLTSELNTLAIEVARECKGLPLAIETVGSALKEKDIEEWKLVLEMLKMPELDDIYEVVDVDVDVAVYACLKLSYDYLKDEKTKLCFLLCSLFPEDYRIHVEELVPYGLGLDLFPSSHSFEEVKRRLHVTLNSLKASCLLLDANENCVKMHDMVRDVARWITSKGDNEFMTKFCMRLMEWSNEKGWERCPRLKILLLGGISGKNMLKISNACFKEMKALKVLILQFADVSIKSLGSLTNLKVLQLFDCTLRDFSYLEKFNKLEVVCHQSCSDFQKSKKLAIIPSNLILRELILDRLPSLSSFFPQNYLSAWPTLEVLKISKCPNLTTFFVSEVKMQDQNLLQLRELIIEDCGELERIICKDNEDGVDAMNGKEIVLLPQLKKLSLKALPRLTSLCPVGYELILKLGASSLQNLTIVFVSECHKLRNLLSSTLAQNLLQLRELTIDNCEEFEQIIFKDDEGVDAMNGKEIELLPQLKALSLKALPRLSSFCTTGYQPLLKLRASSLQNLTVVFVSECHKLENLFSSTLAQNLLQLRELTIEDCRELKRIIFKDDDKDGVDAMNGKEIVLFPQLKKLSLKALPTLTSFCPAGYQLILKLGASSLQNLAVVFVSECHKLENLFSSTLAQNLLQLRELTIEDCSELKRIIFKDDDKDGVDAMNSKEIVLFPQLKKLSLKALPTFTSFCPAGYQLILKLGASSLQNLTVVFVSACHNLRNLFSSTLAQNLLQLRELVIHNCVELEQIIFNDDKDGVDATNDKEIILFPQLKKLSFMTLPSLTSFCPVGYQLILNLESLRIVGFQDEQMWVRILSCLRDVKELFILDCGVKEIQGLSKSSTHVLALQNLSKLNVHGCHKLRHIVVSNLLQLKVLIIYECEELEEINIVEVEDDEENNVHKQTTCAAADDDVRSYHKQLVLPQLQRLWLLHLGSLAKFCSVNYHFIFPSLHDLIIQGCPKIGTRFSYWRGENENGNGSVRAEGKPSEDNPEPPLHIKCCGSEELSKKLPPYVEKMTSRGSASRRG